MPPRGERAAFTVRFPVAQNAVYEERAAELGIPIGSWVALRLAQVEGLPVPAYIEEEIKRAESKRAHEAEQGEFPLARSA
jgi:hypothetical protein